MPGLCELSGARVQSLPNPCLNENSGGRLRDRTLLERAEADSRIVFTLDKDFWQIALQRPIPLKRSGVILLRIFPAIPENLTPLVDSILRADQHWVGHVSVITKEGIEMIPTQPPEA